MKDLEKEIEKIFLNVIPNDDTDELTEVEKIAVKQLTVLFKQEVKEIVPAPYRSNLVISDPKQEWKKGKHGEAVKYYGEGYNACRDEILSKL